MTVEVMQNNIQLIIEGARDELALYNAECMQAVVNCTEITDAADLMEEQELLTLAFESLRILESRISE